MQISHDQAFKELLGTFLPEFVSCFFPAQAKLLDWSSLRFVDQEVFSDLLAGDRRTVDMLAEVRSLDGNPEQLLVHVEIEANPGPGFPERMHNYYTLLRRRRNLPLLPIAIFLRGRQGITLGTYTEELLGLEVLRFLYLLAALPGVPRESLPVENPIVHALAPFLAGRGEDRVALLLDCYRGIIATEVIPERQRLLAAFVDLYIQLDEVEAARLEELVPRVADGETRAMLLTRWEQKGLARGREEGREVGREEGRVSVLRLVLEERFGALPAPVEARLAGVREPALIQSLIHHVLAARDLDDFALRLNGLVESPGNPT